MADKRITELNLHTSPQLSDVIAIVNSGETKKTTYGSLYYGIRDGVVSGSSQIILGDVSGFSSFSSSLNDTFVPYIGATTDVNLGDNDFIAHGIKTEGATDYPIIKLGDYDGVENDAHIIIDNPSATISMKAFNGVSITGELTASLQEGYFWVGDGNDKSTLIPTGSFVQTTQTGSLVESAYISLYSTASQQLVESGSAQPVTFSNIWTQKGVSLVAGSQIVMEKAGTYQFNFVAQLTNTENAVHDSYFWIKYNGNNFPNSSTQMSLQPRKNESNPSAQLMTVNIVKVAQNDGDYIELYWTGDSDTIQLSETPGDGVKPETPSVIANIVRVG